MVIGLEKMAKIKFNVDHSKHPACIFCWIMFFLAGLLIGIMVGMYII